MLSFTQLALCSVVVTTPSSSPSNCITYSSYLLIRWAASQVQIDFHNDPIWLVHHLKINETMDTPQNKRFYFAVHISSPLAMLYRWKENNICQSIWDEGEMLLGTLWGTCQDLWNPLLWTPLPQPEWTSSYQCTSWPFCPLDGLHFFIWRKMGFITALFSLLLTIVFLFIYLFLLCGRFPPPGLDFTPRYPANFPNLISTASTLVPYLLPLLT